MNIVIRCVGFTALYIDNQARTEEAKQASYVFSEIISYNFILQKCVLEPYSNNTVAYVNWKNGIFFGII